MLKFILVFHILFELVGTDNYIILLGCASAMNCPGDQSCDNHKCVSSTLKTISFTTEYCGVNF